MGAFHCCSGPEEPRISYLRQSAGISASGIMSQLLNVVFLIRYVHSKIRTVFLLTILCYTLIFNLNPLIY